MKSDIILAGVGGQGILSIAACIGLAAIHQDLFIKQAEVHGMSQRGGAVHSNLRISDKPVASDLIGLGRADIILSVEPMESLRYLPYLSKGGWLITSISPLVNIPDYPELSDLKREISAWKNHLAIDADKLAAEIGSRKISNMVMLGAASPTIDIPVESFEHGISALFGRKGESVVEMNLAAFRKGRELAF